MLPMCSDIFIRSTIYLLGVWRNRRSYIYISTLCQYLYILTVTKFTEMNRVVGRSVCTLLRDAALGPQRITLVSCRSFSVATSLKNEAMPLPSKEKVYSEKITRIVEDISGLNLLEVADLNSLLKSKLNISDAPVMMAGAAAPAPAAAAPAEEEEEAAPQVIQTSFTVKLNKFDASKKVAIIKEIKSLVEGMNLVQAKKFVESAPAVVKADIAKDEAEKIQAALQAVGGECVVE